MNRTIAARVLTLLLVAAFVLSVASCSSKPTPTPVPPKPTAVPATAQPAAAVSAPKPTATTAPAPTAVPAVKPVELKVATWVAPTHHTTVNIVEKWGKEVEKRSAGRIKSTFYYSEQLGKGKDQYDIASKGIADAVLFVPSYTPGRFMLSTVAELPLLHPTATIGSQIVMSIFDKYLAKEFSDVKVLSIGVTSPMHIFTTKKAVRKLEDLKGLKLRSTGGAVSEMIEVLGAVPVEVPSGDLYVAMERGVVDGMAISYASSKDFGLDKVVKYATDVTLGTNANGMVMNKDTYNKLAPDLQKMIDDVNKELPTWIGNSYDGQDGQGIDWLKKISAEIIKLDAAEDARWKAAMLPVFDKWIKQMDSKGLAGRDVLNAYFDELKKRGITPPSLGK